MPVEGVCRYPDPRFITQLNFTESGGGT